MGVERHRFAIALVCVLPVVAASFVGMRMLSRWRRGVKYGWDDWLLIIATGVTHPVKNIAQSLIESPIQIQLLSFGLIGPSILDIRMHNIGFHVWEIPQTTADLTNQNFEEYYPILLSFNLLSIPILPLAKASIIIILLRVGQVIQPLRLALHVVFIFNAGACIIPWATFIFICPPLEGAGWATHTFGNLQCLSRDQQGHLLLFVNCANLLTDVVVFPVPFFIMRELLSTSLRSKLIFVLTFASSLCVTALSAVKIYVTFRDRILLVDNSDWSYSLEFCITHGEGNVGIIVACVPTLRGLISPASRTGRYRSNQSGTCASLNQGMNFTTIAGWRINSASSGICRSWSHGSEHQKDDHPLESSSDILMTTVVKSSSSPLDDIEHDLFEEPPHQKADGLPDVERGNSINTTELESNKPRHTYRTTPILPPNPAHVRYS